MRSYLATIITLLFLAACSQTAGEIPLDPVQISNLTTPNVKPTVTSTRPMPTPDQATADAGLEESATGQSLDRTPSQTSLSDADSIITKVEPITTAAYVSVAGWSPDSSWLALWTSDQSDLNAQQPASMPGGTLYFWNTASGEMCAMPEYHTNWDREASLQWLNDGSVVVLMPEGIYGGKPCQMESFTLLTDFQSPQTIHPDPALSADGWYRILSTQTKSDNGILTYETKVVSLDDNQELVAVTWQIDERLGDYSGWLGGEWIGPEQFLIYETQQQGPLLLDVKNGAVTVLGELLDLDEIPSLYDEAGYSLSARSIYGVETNTYHLLISGLGLEGNFPPATLYHPESGLLETLPYPNVYWAPDVPGWIFLDSRPIVDGYETNEIWQRRIEDVDGSWQLLASDVGAVLWSPDRTENAFTQGETTLVWQSFPDGTVLGRWETSPYWASPVGYSPDGRFVVATGNEPGQWAYALYVLER